jgi:hypothetical protein
VTCELAVAAEWKQIQLIEMRVDDVTLRFGATLNPLPRRMFLLISAFGLVRGKVTSE